MHIYNVQFCIYFAAFITTEGTYIVDIGGLCVKRVDVIVMVYVVLSVVLNLQFSISS